MLPAGLPVGVITAISETGVQVKPIVDWDRLEYVQFLDYRIEGANSQPNPEARQGALAAPLKALTNTGAISSSPTFVTEQPPAAAKPLLGADGSGRP